MGDSRHMSPALLSLLSDHDQDHIEPTLPSRETTQWAQETESTPLQPVDGLEIGDRLPCFCRKRTVRKVGTQDISNRGRLVPGIGYTGDQGAEKPDNPEIGNTGGHATHRLGMNKGLESEASWQEPNSWWLMPSGTRSHRRKGFVSGT